MRKVLVLCVFLLFLTSCNLTSVSPSVSSSVPSSQSVPETSSSESVSSQMPSPSPTEPDIDSTPRIDLTNSASDGNILIITLHPPKDFHPTEYKDVFYICVRLYQNSTDDLVVTSPGPLSGFATKNISININLANTTPAKNTAAKIQEGIRSLDSKYPGFFLSTAICETQGSWDSTTTNIGKDYMETLYMHGIKIK